MGYSFHYYRSDQCYPKKVNLDKNIVRVATGQVATNLMDFKTFCICTFFYFKRVL